MNISTSDILILPGLSSSGPTHWQSLWEAEHPEYRRVEQQDWFDPNPENWVRNIDMMVQQCHTPPVLVAHSLATIAISYWVRSKAPSWAKGCPIRGAFLVAPADVESESPHRELLQAFCPVPLEPLPFKSIVIASSNDPYGSLERVTQFAKAWGSELVIAGALGHINANSNIGNWPQGQALFTDWLAHI